MLQMAQESSQEELGDRESQLPNMQDTPQLPVAQMTGLAIH